jgi:hypothetical protein
MHAFLEALREQRWDDHRYYHHSRVNQSLHLLSAVAFLASYALLFTQPAAAVLLGWLFAMSIRQVGHFFFEPKGYDEVNQATHAYKEAVKVGYNLRRKQVLLALWALTPAVLLARPDAFGLLAPHADWRGFVDNLARLWLGLGVGAVLFRTLQLCLVRDARTGLVWLTKILTDPFHDIVLYHQAPLRLLRGERLDSLAPKPAA